MASASHIPTGYGPSATGGAAALPVLTRESYKDFMRALKGFIISESFPEVLCQSVSAIEARLKDLQVHFEQLPDDAPLKTGSSELTQIKKGLVRLASVTMQRASPDVRQALHDALEDRCYVDGIAVLSTLSAWYETVDPAELQKKNAEASLLALVHLELGPKQSLLQFCQEYVMKWSVVEQKLINQKKATKDTILFLEQMVARHLLSVVQQCGVRYQTVCAKFGPLFLNDGLIKYDDKGASSITQIVLGI